MPACLHLFHSGRRVARGVLEEGERVVGERAPAFDPERLLAGSQQHHFDLSEDRPRTGTGRKGQKRGEGEAKDEG